MTVGETKTREERRTRENKRERGDPAGSFHNERHPVLGVGKRCRQGEELEEKGKTRQTGGF